LKRYITVLVSFIFITSAASAQDAQDLGRRLQALEQKVEQLQQAQPSTELTEIRRQIDILSKEIESLKNNQEKTAVVADQPQYGMGAAASKVYRSEPGVAFGGYGELQYERPSGTGERPTANVEKAVLYTGYKFNKNILFNSELEVEDASTERGGNVSIEFAYLDFLSRPEVNVRAGLVLLPVGLINEQHEPTAFFGVRRPDVETRIIPATWAEMGGGLFGDVGRFTYRTYVVTGLDAQNFDADEPIREGRQAGAKAVAKDLAWTGRVDFHPFEGTFFGGSLYTGNSGQGLEREDGSRIAARVTLGEIHAESKFRGTTLRALWSRGSIGDAADLNAAIPDRVNNLVSSKFGGWYVEGGYDLASVWPHGETSLTPYARYERFNTQRSVGGGLPANPENDARVLTLGMAFKPIAQTVIKADYQRNKNRLRNSSQFNLGLGYIF